jgi:hypothetical protein
MHEVNRVNATPSDSGKINLRTFTTIKFMIAPEVFAIAITATIFQLRDFSFPA